MQFAQIPGQERAKQLATQAVARGRFAHAQLIAGPEGVGQLAFAAALATYLNCQNPTPEDSCGQCSSCRQMAALQHPDLIQVLPILSRTQGGRASITDDFLETFRPAFLQNPFLSLGEWSSLLDAENKQLLIPVAEIRELQKKVGLKPFGTGYKTVILWAPERMNLEAANAFLKLLEEPPARTVLLLASENPGQLLPTILSRTQRLGLGRVTAQALGAFLLQKQGISPEQAAEAAALAEGSISRAVEVLTQAEQPFAAVYQAWMRACYEGKLRTLNDWAAGMARQSREQQKLFLSYALQKLREANLLRADAGTLVFQTQTEREFFSRFIQVMDADKIARISQLQEEALMQLGRNINPTMLFTLLCLRVHAALRGH